MAGAQIALPARIVGILRDKTLADGQALAKLFHRSGQVALSLQHVANAAIAATQVSLSTRAIGVQAGQSLSDGQVLAKFGQRPGEVSLRFQYAADPVVAEAQVPLPALVLRVLRDKALADRHPLAKLCKCPGQVTLGRHHVANTAVAGTQIALPLCVVRVQAGQSLGDRQILAELDQRPSQVALSLQYVTQAVVAEAQHPLPLRVLGVLCHQALIQRQAFPVSLQRQLATPQREVKIPQVALATPPAVQGGGARGAGLTRPPRRVRRKLPCLDRPGQLTRFPVERDIKGYPLHCRHVLGDLEQLPERAHHESLALNACILRRAFRVILLFPQAEHLARQPLRVGLRCIGPRHGLARGGVEPGEPGAQARMRYAGRVPVGVALALAGFDREH